MNPEAARISVWTENNFRHLAELRGMFDQKERSLMALTKDAVFAHATPLSPLSMSYCEGIQDALDFFLAPTISSCDKTRLLPILSKKVAFTGHIHVPQIYVERQVFTSSNGVKPVFDELQKMQCVGDLCYEKEISLAHYTKAFVVVPSCGQPRDGCALTGYVMYDDVKQTVTIRRISYDVQAAVDAIETAGLPKGSRLLNGV
jgi:hypothetical protein